MNHAANTGDSANVVSLKSHQFKKAIQSYAVAINSIIQSEAAFFSQGKFLPFASSYIESNFKPDFCPELFMDVCFRDYIPKGEAKEFLASLKKSGFEIIHIKYAKGCAPKTNPENRRLGPIARKVLSYAEGRELFSNREHSPYGAYQPSQSGFRSTCIENWDSRGVGFHLRLGGEDNRRGDKYRNPTRYEDHIIDNDKDMQEVADMYAMIQRSKIKSV